jgi:ribonuclease BN (tRNA processing enzyme)
MRIKVLGVYGGESRDCRMTCLLINGSLALDAGSLTQALPVEEQVGVRSILLSHSHMDHTNSLPFFIENVYGKADDAIDIYASPATIYALRKYLFNNATWPDFTRLPNHLLPVMRFHELADEVPVVIDGVKVTPIPVNHLVPTYGFLLEQDGKSVLWSSDTGPTQRLWEVAQATRNLVAVCVETSFPNSMQEIADISLHLTPATLEQELAKLERQVPVFLHHLKPPYLETIRQEVAALAHPGLGYLEQGESYDFS